jgi:uncharacterized protein (TIGR03435 family)
MAVESLNMEHDIRPPKCSIHPPRWAEATLRMCLPSDQAETESGDLLEAYRDSIYPARGRWRADLWFVRQVAGYMLRSGPKLRNWLLAGLALCVLTTGFSALMYPLFDPHRDPHGPRNLALMSAGILFYFYVAVCRTRPSTPEGASVLRLGTRWGVVVGFVWIASWITGNLIIPHRLGAQAAILLALVGFVLPFGAGAHGAIKTGKVRVGMRVGFWSGLISGVMVFLAGATLGYILAFVPGLPGAEIPSADHVYTAAEFQRLNVLDALGGAFAHLFGIGGLFGAISGTLGGWAGILLERTGRGPEASTLPVAMLLSFLTLTPMARAMQSFEVVSIKPNRSGGAESVYQPVIGGRLTVSNVTLKELIKAAYHVAESQISGGPRWMESERFDINAKADRDVSLQEALQMLQTVLTDRFKLESHRETRNVTAYALSTANSPPKLTAAQAGGESGLKATPIEGQKRTLQVVANSMTMQHLADVLGSQLHAPVIDRTGLTGAFDFAFTLEPPSDPTTAASQDLDSSIITALQEQLGLKLETTKAPGEFLIIDHLERPTEN